MRKRALSLFALPFFCTFVSPANAVEGGVTQSWVDHPYLIESQCTGTVIAGKYVLLAGHCAASVSSPFPRSVNLSNGESIMPIARNAEPYDNKDGSWNGGADVALWTLPTAAPMNKAVFFANLNDQTTKLHMNDSVRFIGFGRDNSIPTLAITKNHYISYISSNNGQVVEYKGSDGHSVPGDSGAPVFNSDNKIIAVNYSSSGSVDNNGLYDANGTALHPVKDWLLNNINRWHSANELTFTGEQTIEIQSLHKNNANLATRWNNGTLSTGDVTVTGGTCVTGSSVSPFEICTLELKSGVGEGKVLLEAGNEITINRKKIDPKPDPKPDNGGEGGGGSIEWATLLLLSFLFILRKRSK